MEGSPTGTKAEETEGSPTGRRAEEIEGSPTGTRAEEIQGSPTGRKAEHEGASPGRQAQAQCSPTGIRAYYGGSTQLDTASKPNLSRHPDSNDKPNRQSDATHSTDTKLVNRSSPSLKHRSGNHTAAQHDSLGTNPGSTGSPNGKFSGRGGTTLVEAPVPTQAWGQVQGRLISGGCRSLPLHNKPRSRWDQLPADSHLAGQAGSKSLTIHPQGPSQQEAIPMECSPDKGRCSALSPLPSDPALSPLPLAPTLHPLPLAPTMSPFMPKQASPAPRSTPAMNSNLQTKCRMLNSHQLNTQASPAINRSYNPSQSKDALDNVPKQSADQCSPDTPRDARHTPTQASTSPGCKASANACAHTPAPSKPAQPTQALTTPKTSSKRRSSSSIYSSSRSRSCSLTSNSGRPQTRKRYRSFSDSSSGDNRLRRRHSLHSSGEAAHRHTDQLTRRPYRSTCSSSSFDTSTSMTNMTTSCSEASSYSSGSLAAAYGIDASDADEDPQYGCLNWHVKRTQGNLPIVSSKSMQLRYSWGKGSSVTGTVDTIVWTCCTEVVSWNWSQSGAVSLGEVSHWTSVCSCQHDAVCSSDCWLAALRHLLANHLDCMVAQSLFGYLKHAQADVRSSLYKRCIKYNCVTVCSFMHQ